MSNAPLTSDELVEAFLAERRAGAMVDARTFLARYPHSDPAVLDALEALESLEVASDIGAVPLTPGRIGPFKVMRELGRGGMGVVFEAIEEPLQRRVALKLLPPELTASPAARARFQREAALASRLSHSGICTVYGAGVLEGQPWIAMRCVEGDSLSKRISAARDRHGAKLILPGADPDAPERGIADCIARIARALGAAHAQGIVHRDVKPSNIIVTTSGEPVLVDFGLAFESQSQGATLTRTGELVGTPAYLAPELVSGECERSDERCDVYSLGVTLYECLTLAPPFRGATREALYKAVLDGNASDVRSLNRDISRDLAVIVATAIESDRRARYASAEQLALDLEAFVAHRPISARPVGVGGRLARWASREPGEALLAAALLITALGLAVVGGVLLASRDTLRAGATAERERHIERELFEGYVDLSERRRDEANARFAAVQALDPSNEEARVGRVIALTRLGREVEALELLDDAPDTRVYAALRALARGSALREEDPSWWLEASALELFIEGELCLAQLDRSTHTEGAQWAQRALSHFTEAVARAPKARALYHYLRAYAAACAGDLPAARSAAGALLQLWPDSTSALEQAGAALIELEPHSALPMLERALRANPLRAQSHQNLGIAQLRVGQHERARATFWRALELSPDNVYSLNGLACAEAALGCPQDQRVALERALALAPEFVGALSNLAALEYGEGRLDRALEAWKRLLVVDPALYAHRGMAAVTLFDLGRADEALEQLGIALSYAPRDPLVWTQYGSMLCATGQAELAAECLRAARELDPTANGVEQLESSLRALGGR